MNKIALIAVLVLGGCAATGTHVDQTQMTEFKKGETTYQEVVSALGQPTTEGHTSDGKVEVSYIYSEYQTRPETFIPYVGMFVGGGDTRSNTAFFKFDNYGVLEDYTYTRSQMGTNTGIMAGGTPSRIETVERE